MVLWMPCHTNCVCACVCAAVDDGVARDVDNRTGIKRVMNNKQVLIVRRKAHVDDSIQVCADKTFRLCFKMIDHQVIAHSADGQQ